MADKTDDSVVLAQLQFAFLAILLSSKSDYNAADDKATIKHRYILPRQLTGQEHIQLRRHKNSTNGKPMDSSFPADSNQVILNNMNTKSKANIKRTDVDS